MSKKIRPDWYRFYRQQRGNAAARGITFLLSSAEWWQIWSSSGHYRERGQKSDQYCMARFGDVGPYALNNVEIVTNHENNKYGSTGRKHSEATKRKMRMVHKGVQYVAYKLTREDVIVIAHRARKGVKIEKLAQEYRVSKSTVYRALDRHYGGA